MFFFFLSGGNCIFPSCKYTNVHVVVSLPVCYAAICSVGLTDLTQAADCLLLDLLNFTSIELRDAAPSGDARDDDDDDDEQPMLLSAACGRSPCWSPPGQSVNDEHKQNCKALV